MIFKFIFCSYVVPSGESEGLMNKGKIACYYFGSKRNAISFSVDVDFDGKILLRSSS